jgi:hypothetical protein
MTGYFTITPLDLYSHTTLNVYGLGFDKSGVKQLEDLSILSDVTDYAAKYNQTLDPRFSNDPSSIGTAKGAIYIQLPQGNAVNSGGQFTFTAVGPQNSTVYITSPVSITTGRSSVVATYDVPIATVGKIPIKITAIFPNGTVLVRETSVYATPLANLTGLTINPGLITAGENKTMLFSMSGLFSDGITRDVPLDYPGITYTYGGNFSVNESGVYGIDAGRDELIVSYTTLYGEQNQTADVIIS